MNKLTKASIAGAAGIALLLGGAGSLALWNAEASITGIDINAGELEMTAAAGTVSAPTLWVPGDTGTYKTTLNITAAGDNIEALLEVDLTNVTGGDAELEAVLDVDVAFDAALPAWITDNGDGTYNVTEGSGTNLAVTVTVTFTDDGVTIDNDTQNQSVDLSGMRFLLTQTP